MKKKAESNNRIIAKNPQELVEILGLDSSVALEWEVRREVSTQIVNNFKTMKLKITPIAKRAETSRARITRILKGDTQGISLDVLLRVLGATGQRIEIKFLRTG